MKRSFLQVVKSIQWSKISPATYVRYILMILSIINTILVHLGITPIDVDEGSLYTTVTDILSIAILVANTWCNNSVTQEAIFADKVMSDVANGEVEIPDDDEMSVG